MSNANSSCCSELVEATEEQTEAIERIAAASEAKTHAALVSIMRTALEYCQDGDVRAAAHVLHSALSETGELEGGRS